MRLLLTKCASNTNAKNKDAIEVPCCRHSLTDYPCKTRYKDKRYLIQEVLETLASKVYCCR